MNDPMSQNDQVLSHTDLNSRHDAFFVTGDGDFIPVDGRRRHVDANSVLVDQLLLDAVPGPADERVVNLLEGSIISLITFVV